jgi:hypothetical protein
MNSTPNWAHNSLRIVAVIAIGILAGVQSGFSRGGDRFNAESPVGCRISSWTPELYSFYGDPEKVMDKLSQFDMKLAERRVFMFMVESSDSAEFALFERPVKDPGPWTVWRWKGQPSEARKLREEETNEILTRQGQDCVGKETVKLVESRNPVKQEINNPPTTAYLAFGDVMAHYPKGSYVQVTIFLLC